MGQDNDKDFGLKPGTAIGYSLACALGGDRTMTVQCFVDEAEDDGVVNARIDRVFRVMDRQKAKYDLGKLEKEFEEVALHTRNFLNAIPVAQKTAEHHLAVLQVRLAEQEAAKDEVYKEGYNAHVASNRRSEFKPAGTLQGKLNGMAIDIQKTRDAIAALPADTAQHRATTAVNVAKYQDDMKKRRVEINDLRRLAGKEPYTLFMDEQEAVVEG